ncbi:MAG: helix-turn-helix domain-containing protein [Flavobacteriales bacterium]
MTFSSLIGTYEILTKLNERLAEIGKPPAYDIQLVGCSNMTELNDGMFSIRSSSHFRQVKSTDLIIIPAIPPTAGSVARNRIFLPWIVEQYSLGAEVASICTGAFLLAATGLLKDRKCSTHWHAANRFSAMYPEVELVPDKLITDDQGIYTNGGAFSFLNLIVYLIEKHCGRDVAIYCSKFAEIDMDRDCQSPFSIFLGQKNHEDETVKQAQHYIENHITEKITVDKLASKYAMSTRSFERRFKSATANTPLDYIQRVKIEFAKKSFESGRLTIDEVMYAINYTDRRSFRTIFKKITGMLPLEYRSKYNKSLDRTRSSEHIGKTPLRGIGA